MKRKSDSKIEKLRKPTSRVVAALFLSVALFTVPEGFGGKLHESIEIIGKLFLVVAGLGRIWCSLYIAARKDKVLCTEGPYSICRNPLYFCSFIGVVGAFLALQSISLTIVAVVMFLFYYKKVIQSEEERLSVLFGPAFIEYKSLVPRFIPDFSKYAVNCSERNTSTKVIEKNMREVLWFFVTIVIVDVLELVHQNGTMVFARLPF